MAGLMLFVQAQIETFLQLLFTWQKNQHIY